ncbi:hypothetical protein HPB50_017090 [Hyalomma asiaticum]|uniref:Uncharacterized protein n=1 Tax=Hyalomma asiaticum TaxID=266040 RepID=A0ACB7TJG3_HYAAI|nr:hypothetical protein HPB50_017090 [Hyalomma asiaticum]
MNLTRSPINLQRKFRKTITRRPGARTEDLHNVLQFVPARATAVILHVGTNDLASTKDSVAVFKECPNVRRIFGTQILPRATNRRRGNNNRAFVHKVNTEASFFNQRLRQFCRGSTHVFYVDHGFEFLPVHRVLAADGLHTSFEGTALLATATETTEIPLTSQEEFPRLPPPPLHPAPPLPHERTHRDECQQEFGSAKSVEKGRKPAQLQPPQHCKRLLQQRGMTTSSK